MKVKPNSLENIFDTFNILALVSPTPTLKTNEEKFAKKI